MIHIVTPILLKKIPFDTPARRCTTCYRHSSDFWFPSLINSRLYYLARSFSSLLLPSFLATSVSTDLSSFWNPHVPWITYFAYSRNSFPQLPFPPAQYQCLFVHHISECPVNSPFSLKTTTFDFIFPSSACLGFLFPLLQIFARKLSLYCLNSCSLLCAHSA